MSKLSYAAQTWRLLTTLCHAPATVLLLPTQLGSHGRMPSPTRESPEENGPGIEQNQQRVEARRAVGHRRREVQRHAECVAAPGFRRLLQRPCVAARRGPGDAVILWARRAVRRGPA